MRDTKYEMRDTNKIAVLGHADFVMLFSALGVDTYSADRTEQIAESAERIISDKYALVIVAEDIAPAAEEVFSAYENLPTPCIVVVPFTTESQGFATQALGELLRRATGIDILQND